MLEMRPVINQTAKTIDHCISRLQSSHLQFLSLMMEDFSRTSAPPVVMQPLRTIHGSASKRPPDW